MSQAPCQTHGEGDGGEKRKNFNDTTVTQSSDPESDLNSDSKDSPSPTIRPSKPGIWSQRKSHVEKFKTALSQFVKVITRTKDIPPSKDGRRIELNASRNHNPIDERTGKPYISNIITSSRYTLYNFIPRQLLFQFSRVSNFYFLCIAVLQLTGFSTTGTYSTLVPLMAFVSIAMAKEGFDDYRRHLLDRVENRNTVEILHADETESAECGEITSSEVDDKAKGWAEVKWAAVKIGDIVRVRRNDAVPADLVILYSDGPNGMAYIDTAALDGESNLKARQASPILRNVCQDENDLAHCRAHVVVEDPNLDLYNFDGRITIGEETLPLTGNEVIYRGSVLRNTSQAFGMVINTGEECKIRMNATKNPKAKAPSMQHIVNQVVVIIATFVLVLTGLNNAAYGVWQDKVESKSWYLQNASVTHGALFASSFVMFSTMIPLSLYISLEIVKVGQMYILGDIDMYDPESDTPMEPRTNTINEELGQITHVFSDKTGTLTENIMRFRKMSVAGTAWLHDFDLKERAVKESYLQKSKTTDSALGEHTSISRPSMASRRPSMAVDAQAPNSNSEPTTRDLLSHLQRSPDGQFARKVKFFLLAIALCHTALPEVQEDGEIDYQAMSPDELALVRAAKDLGVIVVDRPAQSMKILIRDKNGNEKHETYEVLDVVEFSSKRKRMSIIIRFPNGKICLFCKGADSTIIKRLKTANEAIEKDAEIRRNSTSKRLSEAKEVLRQQSEDGGPRRSFARSRSQLGRPSLVSRRSTGDGRTSIGDLVRTSLRLGYDSPRASMAASRRSSNYEVYHRSVTDHHMTLDDSSILDSTLQHIHEFATEGLRTLMYGYKFLGEDEYLTWKKLFHEASTSLVNRQDLIDQSSETLERNLDLAGATAIEDELQKGVPETIDKLRRAGMRLWMLTGDKRETAINIGHSCKLIKSYSEVIILDHEKGNLEETMSSNLLDIMHGDIAHSVVVVDGQTLSDIEINPILAKQFFDLVIAANSVICCRASPTQKAFLVKTVRTKVKRSVTLAVGDSANDIAMIQEAHVGIGISGKEGMQAARTSDYSIGQFRFLQKLLLVHGRWNYIRTGKYILGTFWKEMMFFLTQAIYQGYNGFTGTSLYEYWSGSVINVIFCALCIIFLGMFEKDLEANTLLAVPELYMQGQRNEGFNLKKYAWWNFMALVDAVLIYYFVHLAYGIALFNDVFIDSDDLFAFGQLAFAICIVVINSKLLLLEMHNKTIITGIGYFCGIGGWWAWNMILSAIYNPANNTLFGVKDGFMHRFGRSGLWWLVLVLTSAAVLLWEVAVSACRIAWFPNDIDLFQELERDPIWSERFRENARGDGGESDQYFEIGLETGQEGR